jgi:hypothetical protein
MFDLYPMCNCWRLAGEHPAGRSVTTGHIGVWSLLLLLLLLQVVAFQAMMEVMADKFPGAFAGYTLKVSEPIQPDS